MENELEVFFNISQDLICIANTDGYFERVNPQFGVVLGYSDEELTQNPFITFVHPDDHKRTVDEVKKLSEGHPTVNFSNRFRKKSGEYIWLEWMASPRMNKMYAIARDVTEKRKLVDDLDMERKNFLDLSKRYEFATESAGIGVWYWNIEENQVVWNNEMYRLYDMNKDEFDGTYQSWNKLAFEEERAMVEGEIQKAIDCGGQFDITFRIHWKDGSVHYIHGIGTAEQNAEGQRPQMIGVNVDVTKEKDLDLARSNFISFASHQLRTPLTGIRWVADKLMGESLSGQGKVFVQDIEESALQLSKLVDTMLNLSRLEGGNVTVKPESFDLILFLDEFLDEMHPALIRKNLQLKKEPYPPQLDIVSDRYMLQNIVQSIFSNAIEYTPDRGSITIGVIEEGDSFRLLIKDTGVGIPKQDQGTIFRQFSRGSNADSMKSNGTGLGLYIAKQSVDFLHGKIWFESEEGKGTTFCIEMPKRVTHRKA